MKSPNLRKLGDLSLVPYLSHGSPTSSTVAPRCRSDHQRPCFLSCTWPKRRRKPQQPGSLEQAPPSFVHLSPLVCRVALVLGPGPVFVGVVQLCTEHSGDSEWGIRAWEDLEKLKLQRCSGVAPDAWIPDLIWQLVMSGCPEMLKRH